MSASKAFAFRNCTFLFPLFFALYLTFFYLRKFVVFFYVCARAQKRRSTLAKQQERESHSEKQVSPGAKTVIPDNDLHSAFTVSIAMDPVFPLPLQERVLREVVDKAKDYALMHGGHTDEIQRPLTRTA